MNKIAQKAVKYFEFQHRPTDTQILSYSKQSPFYDEDIDDKKLITAVRRGLQNPKKEILKKLQFHFARETNKLLFDIYQIILKSPKGLKYKDIGAALKDNKTNNIAISHYCRKLYKTNFLSVSYVKEGTFVTAIRYKAKRDELKEEGDKDEKQILRDGQQNEDKEELKIKLSQGFLIREFSIDSNIMLNISGTESLLKDGLTKQQISSNIFKVSEKKTISRIIENSKFQRDGERKGRIYGFRFKGDLTKIRDYTQKHSKIPSKTSIVELESEVEHYLQQKFPDIEAPNLLQYLVDQNKPQRPQKQIKQIKQNRQCDPIKLSRFIYILNYLTKLPSTFSNLLSYIIEQDKINHKVNIGTMHKKSLFVIINTLLKMGVIVEEDGVIYPTWKKLDKLQFDEPSHISKQPKQLRQSHKRTKYGTMISQKEGHHRFTAQQIFQNIRSSWINMLRFAFRQIKKSSFSKEEPQVQKAHALNILDMETAKIPSLTNPTSIEDLFSQIDTNLQPFLKIEQELKFLDHETKKYLRFYPTKKVSEFVKRFGKTSIDKIQEMVDRKIMTVQGEGDDERYNISNEIYMV